MPSPLQDALGMFAFLAIELSALFIGISLLVGVLQRHIPPERIESLLSSRRKRSYLLAAGLGAITPFCSCSTIPMLKGLIRSCVGFGPMMVFLFSSPLLNPVIVGLLLVTFGLTLTLIYVLAAFLVSVAAGWSLQAMGFERYIRSSGEATQASCDTGTGSCSASTVESAGCNSAGSTNQASRQDLTDAGDTANPTQSCCGTTPPTNEKIARRGRYAGLWHGAWSDYREVFPYLIVGIAIGAAIYGYMPTELLERYAGADNPLAIAVAAVIGIPLYLRTEAVIPLAGALLAKGVGAGTVLALIIGSAGASLTELILLRSLFRTRLLAAFVVVILAMAMVAGFTTYLFNPTS